MVLIKISKILYKISNLHVQFTYVPLKKKFILVVPNKNFLGLYVPLQFFFILF